MKKRTLVSIVIVLLAVKIIFVFIFLKPTFSGEAVGAEINNGLSDRKNLEKAFVTKVIDGDTVIVNGESVRLLGIDSDERGENCYKEAKKRMEELVLNKEILLEKDMKDRDQYKRLLRWIFVEDNNEKAKNVNLILVEDGLAIARFYEDRKYKEEILLAEKNARENKIGCKWRGL